MGAVEDFLKLPLVKLCIGVHPKRHSAGARLRLAGWFGLGRIVHVRIHIHIHIHVDVHVHGVAYGMDARVIRSLLGCAQFRKTLNKVYQPMV